MSNSVRIGTVSSVNVSNATARVAFFDQDDMVSSELPVIYPASSKDQFHWMPEAGSIVVCVFSGKDGFIAGTYYGRGENPPGSDCGVWFEDGSHVFYDRTTGVLNVKAAGGVRIEGDLVVTGSITRAGESL